MTRLRRTIAPRGGRPLDLPRAFTLLGKAPSRADLGWAIDRLRESGVEEVEFDDSLVAIAEAAGSSAFVALDLCTAFFFGVELRSEGPRARPVSESP